MPTVKILCPWCQGAPLMRHMSPIPGDPCHARAEVRCGACGYRELPPKSGYRARRRRATRLRDLSVGERFAYRRGVGQVWDRVADDESGTFRVRNVESGITLCLPRPAYDYWLRAEVVRR